MKHFVPSKIIEYPFFNDPGHLYKFLFLLNRINKKDMATSYMELMEVLQVDTIDMVNVWLNGVQNTGFIKFTTYPNGTIKIVFKKIKTDTDNTTPIEQRKKAFYEQVAQFVIDGKYEKKLARDFFNYWSETNKSKTKMRFEMQETWELELRIQRFANNQYVRKPTHQSNSGYNEL